MIVGIICLCVEMLIPGGILGLVGGGFLLAACAVTFVQFGVQAGLLTLLGSLALAGAVFFAEVKLFPRTRVGKRAILEGQIHGVSAQFGPEAAALIGSTGKSLTVLSPTGLILVDGKQYEAFSRDGQIPAGADLRITGVDAFRLIVTSTLQA